MSFMGHYGTDKRAAVGSCPRIYSYLSMMRENWCQIRVLTPEVPFKRNGCLVRSTRCEHDLLRLGQRQVFPLEFLDQIHLPQFLGHVLLAEGNVGDSGACQIHLDMHVMAFELHAKYDAALGGPFVGKISAVHSEPVHIEAGQLIGERFADLFIVAFEVADADACPSKFMNLSSRG